MNMCKTYAWSSHVLSKEVSQYIRSQSICTSSVVHTYPQRKTLPPPWSCVPRQRESRKKHQASQRFENYGHALSNVRWRKVIASWISRNSWHKGLADCESMLHVNFGAVIRWVLFVCLRVSSHPQKFQDLGSLSSLVIMLYFSNSPTNVTQQAGHGKSKPQEFWFTFLYHIHVTEKRCICICIVCVSKKIHQHSPFPLKTPHFFWRENSGSHLKLATSRQMDSVLGEPRALMEVGMWNISSAEERYQVLLNVPYFSCDALMPSNFHKFSLNAIRLYLTNCCKMSVSHSKNM